MAVGGAITAAPDMHRYLVDGNHWLSETQFTSSIAIAQAAPAPMCCSSPCWAGTWD
jgi:chromate transporter